MASGFATVASATAVAAGIEVTSIRRARVADHLDLAARRGRNGTGACIASPGLRQWLGQWTISGAGRVVLTQPSGRIDRGRNVPELMPHPLSLDDQQMSVLRRMAKVIPHPLRSHFLQAVADQLVEVDVLTTEDVERCTGEVIERMIGRAA